MLFLISEPESRKKYTGMTAFKDKENYWHLFLGKNWYCDYFVILIPIIAVKETEKKSITTGT